MHQLLDAGFAVHAIVRESSDIRRISGVVDCERFSSGTLADVQRAFEEGIDHIIHTATCYGRSGEPLSVMIESNLMLPLQLLEHGIAHGVRTFVNTDTFSDENIAMQGKERFYVKTKKDFLLYAKSAVEHSTVNLCNMVIEQLYGPDDNHTKFIPFVVRELLQGKSEIGFTPGEQKRDFVYVADAARAFVQAVVHADQMQPWQAFGIGTGSAISLKSTVMLLKDIIGAQTQLNWGAMPYRENEIMEHAADISNNERIKWLATTPLENGLQNTVDWYQKQV